MSALSPAIARPLIVLALLGAAFAVYTQAVAAGVTGPLDLAVARALARAWVPALQPLAQAIAVLGGIEATVLVAAGLLVLLLRRGFRAEAAALIALPLVEVLEIVYKLVLRHPAPLMFAHPDGPSVVTMFHAGTLTSSGSYPSGHMMRTVLIYGLGAFVVRRLATPGWARVVAVPAAAAVIGLMTLDRVYLGVHWQSDVVGGLLLGGAVLAGVIAWLDRPRAVA
ncbi:MAG TPA: phosphatase PAP2 family protein [Candidatus Dormibacteraeota bacterium]